jgi:hypothetical protein
MPVPPVLAMPHTCCHFVGVTKYIAHSLSPSDKSADWPYKPGLQRRSQAKNCSALNLKKKIMPYRRILCGSVNAGDKNGLIGYLPNR